MLVANSFDLWQKDTFFSAAEEVQQSADIMESAYRTWLKARKEGLIPQDLDELSRELQMALGTAKWQLEEFERAVRLSYRNKGDDITITRHRQFVSAIEDQISRVENTLKESFNVEGKNPFRWVNLDQEECDDLALFLSGTSDESDKNTKKDSDSEEAVMSNEDISIELQENKVPETGDEVSYQADRVTSNRRARSSPGGMALEIVVDNDDREKNGVIKEATPKEKGFKPFFGRSQGKNCAAAKDVLTHAQMKMMGWINQQLRGGHRSQRQVHVPPMSPVNSIRFVLALMLTLFLVVPFLLYSS